MAQTQSVKRLLSTEASKQTLSLSIATPIGRVLLAATAAGLVRIELPSPLAEMRMHVWLALHLPLASHRSGVSPILRKAASQIEAYFTGGLDQFSLPLHAVGTSFQLTVWAAVSRVPFGETRSYRDIARAVGQQRAVRAVGAAQAANPLPIVIPCHRIIGSDGRLTGYAAGLATKRWLLEHEAACRERTAPGRRPPGPWTASRSPSKIRP